jgi:DeoR/GlpR family transcriptional regulator of sugar metabolism
MTGPLALASLSALRFDTAVLSCCGLAEGHVTAYDLGGSAVKKAMLAAAERVVLVAEASKFARTAMAVVCEAAEVDVLVTSAAAPDELVAAWVSRGVEVFRA